MRTIRPVFLILLYLGLVVYVGSTTTTIAGQTDLPHQVHMEFLRGPGMGGDGSACLNCHTSGSPGTGDIDLNACDTCHSSGGVFDGLNDPDFGALNNWENFGSSDPATKSLIYGVGGLKPGKEKWCVGCHDSHSADVVVLAVDDFEGYSSDSELQAAWTRTQDADPPDLYTTTAAQGSTCMMVDVVWTRSTYDYGSIKRIYNPAIDLDNADGIGFWLRIESDSKFKKFKVRILSNGVWSVAIVGFNAFNIEQYDWAWILLPREDFTENADWSSVEAVQIRAMEDFATQSYSVYFWVDDVKFFSWGSISDAPNVVGNDLTWGHFVTGHRFECAYCHDINSAHIDGQTVTSIYDYFANTTNPTGFRLYSDPGYGLQLPYNEYIPGPDGAFALCYQCHDEAVVTQSGLSETLTTNFTDEDYIPAGPENLHLYHVQMTPVVYHTTCVMCHDPHGQANPAMMRADAGDWLYYDTNGCEIPFGADSDSDGTMDWYDPDINQGGAQRTKKPAGSYPMCTMVCHNDAAPPNPDCAGSNPYLGGTGMNGFTDRSYEYVPHDENMDIGPICLTAGCHPVGPLHGTHFEPAPGPDFPPNESGCYYCHDDGRAQCQGAPVFADHELFADTTVCDTCHSSGAP